MRTHEGESTLKPETLCANHHATGEPLSWKEMIAIVGAGLAEKDDFEMRGGGLWWNWRIYPATEE